MASLSSSTLRQDTAASLQAPDIIWTQSGEALPVKVERDMQGVTVEGFRTLGVVSTFIAGVEAQCLILTANADIHAPLTQAVNAFLLIGLLFSAFGAATSLLAARWFDLLKGIEVDLLEHQWECTSQKANREKLEYSISNIKKAKHIYSRGSSLSDEEVGEILSESNYINDILLAKAIFLSFYFVVFGFVSFVLGIVVYVWAFQSPPIAAVCTLVALLGTTVIICLHLDFHTVGALAHMKFNRIRILRDKPKESLGGSAQTSVDLGRSLEAGGKAVINGV